MTHINLLGNLDLFDDEEETEEEIQLDTLIMCGCGNHLIDSTKDPYKEHNNWIENDEVRKIESSTSALHNLKGTGASAPKISHSYDFSGEEFEVTNRELRKVGNNKDNSSGFKTS